VTPKIVSEAHAPALVAVFGDFTALLRVVI